MVTARQPDQVADLAAAHGGRALALALDVTDPGRVTAAVDEGDDAEIRALFDANVFGVVDITRAVLPGMRARRSGHVANISSMGGLVAFGATGYYHAAKFAVEGRSESLAAEAAPLGIKVTIVEPAAFRTNWSGPSMLQSAERIADYDDTAGARRSSTLATFGRQPGDPDRAAEAVITAVGAEEPPLRLLLGKAAYTVATSKLDALRAGFEAWRAVTDSADFPADTPAG